MADNYRFEWHGNEITEKIDAALRRTLTFCAADLQGKSAPLAPIDTGDLRSNCNVSPVTETGDGFEVSTGYDLPYAIRQHEHLEYHHPKGGQAKYLEKPFNDNKAYYSRKINDAVRDIIGESQP